MQERQQPSLPSASPGRFAVMLGALLAAAFTVCGATAALGQPVAVAAAPMRTPGPNPTYPRLTALADGRVMARVNARLAAKEKEDRAMRRDCRSSAGPGRPRGDWATRTEVTYLSPRFLSVEVVSDYDCGGPYPNDGIETPVTFDLATGAEVVWAKLFKPGFLPVADAAEGAAPSRLTRLYRARYPKGADAECRTGVMGGEPFESAPILWLDAKRGLVVKPDFPHVSQACAEEATLTPAALAPYLRDPALLADLTATIRPR